MRKELIAGFVVGLAILLAVAIVTYRTAKQLVEDMSLVTQTRLLGDHLEQLLTFAARAESDSRDYVLRRDRSHSSTSAYAVDSLRHQTAYLRQLTRDDRAQQRALDVLEPLLMEKMAMIQESVDLRSRKGFEEASKIVRSGRGLVLMDSIRTTIAAMKKGQRLLLEERLREAASTIRATVLIAGAGSLSGFGILFLMFVLLNREVSRRRRAERELREAKEVAGAATKAKSDFLAMMSHELRTPLNSVIGMNDLLLKSSLTNEQRDYANTIQVSSESLLAIIDDILDFLKIESGKIELDRRPFGLKTCVEKVVGRLAPKAAERGLDLHYRIDSQAPPFVIGDDFRIQQILVNLVDNAIKFTDRGEVSVNVQVPWRLGSDLELQFSVQDTGIGIPANKLDHVFKPFSQIDSSITRRHGGTGLGLAISTSLAELMGGRIWAESEVANGSTFYFTMKSTVPPSSFTPPTVNVPEAPSSLKPIIKEPEKQAGETMNPQTPLSILIAEDNPINQKLLLTVLRQLGYRADVANNGQEVLTAVEKTRYDILFMDVHMPEMDGLEATRRIIDTVNPSERPIIVAVTADALQGDRDKCLEAGMDDYVSKPIRIADIQGILERWGQKAERKGDAVPPPPTEEEQQLTAAMWERIRQLGLETDTKLILEVVESYAPLFESQIDLLLKACAAKESSKIIEAAHSMKGASVNIGAREFATLCQSVEERARKGQLEGLDPLLEEVKRKHAQVVRALSAIKAKLGS